MYELLEELPQLPLSGKRGSVFMSEVSWGCRAWPCGDLCSSVVRVRVASRGGLFLLLLSEIFSCSFLEFVVT